MTGSRMNPKENARRILRFDAPERVVTGIPAYGIGYHGVNHQGYGDAGMGNGHDRPVGAKWHDIWNTVWHKEYPDVMGFPKGNPLAEIDAMNGYSWPDSDDERICGKIYRDAEGFHEKDAKFLTGSHRDTLWEKAYMLVGMENMMAYFYTDPLYAKEILHRIMDFQLGIALHYVNVGVEMVDLGDDLGTQHSLIMSPEIMEEFLVPEYRRLFGFYRERKILIGFHSCGHVEPVLEMLIGLGADVLNPVQATANNMTNVIRTTHRRMALSGGISTGLVMDGPVDMIREEVKRNIRILGKDGGYFCGPDQGMPFPKRHIDALHEAVEEYGKYPLDMEKEGCKT
jgi:uroporphyrinogen decarboxylase